MKTKTLYEQLLDAEAAEKKATQKRTEIESELFNYLTPKLSKQEGQETIEEFGYSITVNQPMNYKLDEEKYRALSEKMPEEFQFHRIKIELDKHRYNSLLNISDSPLVKKWLKQAQDCVSVKPGKVSIKVKKI